MGTAIVVLLIAAVLLRHPLLSGVLVLTVLLLVLGALVGEPIPVLIGGYVGTVLAVGLRIVRQPRYRVEPYVCGECGQPWERHEVWNRRHRVWLPVGENGAECPFCHALVR